MLAETDSFIFDTAVFHQSEVKFQRSSESTFTKNIFGSYQREREYKGKNFFRQDIHEFEKRMRLSHILYLNGPERSIVSTWFATTRKPSALLQVSYTHLGYLDDIVIPPEHSKNQNDVEFLGDGADERCFIETQYDNDSYEIDFPLQIPMDEAAGVRSYMRFGSDVYSVVKYMNQFNYFFEAHQNGSGI